MPATCLAGVDCVPDAGGAHDSAGVTLTGSELLGDVAVSLVLEQLHRVGCATLACVFQMVAIGASFVWLRQSQSCGGAHVSVYCLRLRCFGERPPCTRCGHTGSQPSGVLAPRLLLARGYIARASPSRRLGELAVAQNAGARDAPQAILACAGATVGERVVVFGLVAGAVVVDGGAVRPACGASASP